MATAAVSCSFLSSVGLDLQVARAASGAASSSGRLLAWNPLRRSAGLRSGASILFSSSPIAFSRECIGTEQKLIGPKVTSLRSSSGDDGESKQVPEIEEADEDQSAVAKISESGKRMFVNMFTSAANRAVVAVMVALLVAQPSQDAFAASSGGRMGGKAFSSKPAPSRSYSGGGGGGRSYSGGGGGYVAPPIYASPYGYSPFGYSPFYGGGYGGGLFLGPPIAFGGGGAIVLAMVAFATLRAVLVFVRDRFGGGENEDDRFDD